jgi:hypothetical protein
MITQPVEILSQLDQFKELVNHDFMEEPHNVKIMLEKTLELMKISNSKILEENTNLNMECSKCNHQFRFGKTQLLEIDDPEILGDKLSSVIEAAVLKFSQGHSEICQGNIHLSSRQFLLFIYFKEPRNMQVPLYYQLFGENFKYKSHVREVPQNNSFKYETHFVHENHQFMNDTGFLKLSASTEFEENIKILVLSRHDNEERQPEHVNQFSLNALRSIRKRTDKMTLNERHSQQLQKKREHSAK